MAEFQNPQHEPGTEKRLLLVFVLTFVIIILFQPLLKKYLPQPPEQKQETAKQENAPPSQPQPPAAAISKPPQTAAPRAAAKEEATSEAETVIENGLYKIAFSNRGAQVKSWVLKKYDDDKGKPLELVNRAAADKYGYPLSLWTYDENLRNKLNSALYVVKASGTQAPAEITFEYSDGEVSAQKIFKFEHNYVVEVRAAVEVNGAVVSAFPTWPSGFGDETTPASYAVDQITYQNDSKIERLAIKKISGGGTIPGPFQWAGVEDQYFAAIFIPQAPQNAAITTLRNTLTVPKDANHPENKETASVEVLGAAVGNLKGPTEARVYVGPKSLADLESVPVPAIVGAEPDLRKVVDFGWLGYIARPLFLWLKWTYKYVPNWGWAIIVQTIIINLALLPLRLSQMKSMLKMQRVAPQIKQIQEKYKKYSLRDPRKAEMNQEISALYKKEGVNPVGGCLPMLIQMPFLFAYYRMLGVAIDLRHAPWLWIRDLSAADPLHLLPIGIIITMLFMQRMTPQAGMDPAQQKMMNVMMPIMLGVISWNLAAGLCLYWSLGNLIGIAQQAALNRTTLGREMREMMEKRARKKEK